jgi:ABC-type Na+ efflux pump permease subunit
LVPNPAFTYDKNTTPDEISAMMMMMMLMLMMMMMMTMT